MATTAPYTSEERILAAVAHFSVLLFGWGIFLPMIVWVVGRGKSAFARFQSLQAAAYTIAVFALYVVVSPVLAVAVTLVTLVLAEIATNMAGMGFGIFALCLAMGAALNLWPLFLTLGFWAALQTLHGRFYRYPLIGGWMERWLARSERGGPPVAMEVSA